MYTQNLSVPFRTTEAYHGFAEVEGMMRVEEQQLVLEFMIKDSLLGVLKSSTKKLVIPYSELSEVYFKSSIWGSKVFLHINSMEILSKFPTAKDGVIKLKIKRKNKAKARELDSFMRMRLSEHKLNMLDEAPPEPFF